LTIIEPIKKNLIYFTGFMAGGKSTIGPIVANSIDYRFMDLDKEIEKSAGKTVNEIFSDLGEASFRKIEKELLVETSNLDKYVISLGGGTIVDAENLKIVKSSGLLIYLKSEIEYIYKRLRYKSDRPVFKSKDGNWLRDEELKNRISELFKLREPIYALADLTFETDKTSVGKTVDSIVKKIKPLIEL
jgi:shikimate kinase